jgi:ribose transport system ATP-binding protein
MSEPILSVNNISKAFFGIPAVKNVSIQVNGGQVLGLIGQNGAGKSTLMNLVGGVVTADSGTMTFQNSGYAPRKPADASAVGIAFIHQELNLFTNLTIAENIFIDKFPTRGFWRAIDTATMKKRTQELLKAVNLDLPHDMAIDRMSPGERQLVEIAKALHIDAQLIIFDEPTTSLTARETQKLFELIRQLREQGKSMIYISHILNDVLALSDEIAVMRDGELVIQEPKNAFSVDRMISLMVGRSLEQLYPPRSGEPTQAVALQTRAVTQNGIVNNINLTLHQGEVLGLFGLMGSGRTELARILFGLDSFENGEIALPHGTITHNSPRNSIRNGMAFVTENRREEGLMMSINIQDNTTTVALPSFTNTWLQVLDSRAMSNAAQDMASVLQLKSGNIQRQAVKALSGGNQQKVVIAKWLLSQPSVFIMDEPTRGIDVGAKYEIYAIIDRLATSGSSVLFISSEVEELMGCCDRILVMSQGEIVGEFARAQFDKENILRAAFREGELAQGEPTP